MIKTHRLVLCATNDPFFIELLGMLRYFVSMVRFFLWIVSVVLIPETNSQGIIDLFKTFYLFLSFKDVFSTLRL